MTKHYCDRCKDELYGVGDSGRVTLPGMGSDVDLCSVCKDRLKYWLRKFMKREA